MCYSKIGRNVSTTEISILKFLESMGIELRYLLSGARYSNRGSTRNVTFYNLVRYINSHFVISYTTSIVVRKQ